MTSTPLTTPLPQARAGATNVLEVRDLNVYYGESHILQIGRAHV